MLGIIIPLILIIIYILINHKRKNIEEFNSDISPTPSLSLKTKKSTSNDKVFLSSYLTHIHNRKNKYKIELIKLNPLFDKKIFSLETITGDDGTTISGVPINIENTDWKADFQRRLCIGCSCLNPESYEREDEDDSEEESPADSPADSPAPTYENFSNLSPSPEDIVLCGMNQGEDKFQCANTCPECNLCHMDNSGTSRQYYDKCNIPQEASDRELCSFFKERVIHVKDKCIFPHKLKDVKLNDKECYSFYRKLDNRYIKNQIIIFRITSTDLAQNIQIKKLYYRKNNNIRQIKPIVFYSDSYEHYFYINTKNLNDFKDDIIINFKFDITRNNQVKTFNDKLKIYIENLLDYIPRYNEEIGHTIEKRIGTVPSSFDDYDLNYLVESEPKTKQLVNGYSMKNKLENTSIGEFVRYEFKDSPQTWKIRSNINRPWISVG